MKSHLSVLSVFQSLPLLALAIGCANQSGNAQGPVAPGEQPGPTVVYETPPPPQPQAPVPAPGPEYAYSWVPGYWTWQGAMGVGQAAPGSRGRPRMSNGSPASGPSVAHRYIWIRGHWQ